MITAICEITLAADTSRKVKVRLSKEGDSKFLWKMIEASKEGLKLPASNGTWIAPYSWGNTLTLLGTNNLMLVAYKIKDDFWNDLTANKTVETDDATLINGNPSEEKVTCKLSNG